MYPKFLNMSKNHVLIFVIVFAKPPSLSSSLLTMVSPSIKASLVFGHKNQEALVLRVLLIKMGVKICTR